jgi:cell division protein FtsB
VQRIRIKTDRIYRMRRMLATIVVALIAILIGYKVVFGANGMLVYRAKRIEYRAVQEEIEREKAENQRLQQRVKALQSDPKAIEEEARRQFGYVKPGEIVLVDPQPKADPRSAPAYAQQDQAQPRSGTPSK